MSKQTLVTALAAGDRVLLNEEVFIVVKTGRGLKERTVTYRRPGARSDDTFTITHLATSVVDLKESYMNPIEKALATADDIQAANRELEQVSALHVIPTVTNRETAVAFLTWAVKRIGGGFHPDTRGNDYLALAADGGVTGPTFNESEAIYFDNQIEQVFRFLPDPYAITLDLVHADEEERIAKVGVHPRTEDCNPGNCEIAHAVEVHGENDLHGEPIKTSLVIAYDVTGWTQQQIDSLALSAQVQGEAYRDDYGVGDEDRSYPDVHDTNYEIIEHDGDLDLTGVLHVGLGR